MHFTITKINAKKRDLRDGAFFWVAEESWGLERATLEMPQWNRETYKNTQSVKHLRIKLHTAAGLPE